MGSLDVVSIKNNFDASLKANKEKYDALNLYVRILKMRIPCAVKAFLDKLDLKLLFSISVEGLQFYYKKIYNILMNKS